jgi:hypothetical protein
VLTRAVFALSDALPSLESAEPLLAALAAVVRPLPADAPERAQLSGVALSLLQCPWPAAKLKACGFLVSGDWGAVVLTGARGSRRRWSACWRPTCGTPASRWPVSSS